MIARPTVTALSCRSCRGALLRAVVAAPAPRYRNLHLQFDGPAPARTTTAVPRRAFSTDRAATDPIVADESSKTSPKDDLEAVENEVLADTPWFLEIDPPRHVPVDHKVELPTIPEDAPAMLEPMLKYIYEDMGLDDLAMLDLRELDPAAALGPNLIMLFGTARSERHLHVSSGRFVRWLRKNHKVSAKADGLIGPGELKTKLRRLRKKAKLMGTNTAMVPGGDNGISTGWICVNFATSGDDAGEAVSFDESGRFSGFGTAATGTTIVVQCMTEARRNELDLESLWQSVLRKSLDQAGKINGEAAANRSELDALVARRIQLPKPSFQATQWQAMKAASEKHRAFSTMARRLQTFPDPSNDAASAPTDQAEDSKLDAGTADTTSEDAQPRTLTLEEWGLQLEKIQVAGLSIREEILPDLVSALIRAPSEGGTATKRLELLDGLLLTAQERGMTVYSRDMLVTMIAAMAASPDHGPELLRAQENLELILREMDTPLEPNQVLQLMMAYAQRMDWDKFWDVFRSPTRFCQRRSPEQYVLAYRVMTATRDVQLCTDALRWVYPEMVREDPPIWPTGDVYESLKACIRVVDPAAENLLKAPPPDEKDGLFGARRWKAREFLKVLREVEQLNSEAIAMEARAARERII